MWKNSFWQGVDDVCEETIITETNDFILTWTYQGSSRGKHWFSFLVLSKVAGVK